MLLLFDIIYRYAKYQKIKKFSVTANLSRKERWGKEFLNELTLCLRLARHLLSLKTNILVYFYSKGILALLSSVNSCTVVDDLVYIY